MVDESEDGILLPRAFPKGALFAGMIFLIMLSGLFVRIAYADDLPQDILDWISSNGTKGSPVHVLSGNVTFNGSSTARLVRSGNNSGQGGSNPPATLNLTITPENVTSNSTVIVHTLNVTNVTSNASGGGSLIGNITPINMTVPISNLTEVQQIVEKNPIISVYAGENYTVYVQDNKQSSAWFKWMVSSMATK